MLRVGYVPYSRDLQHPADRRRIAIWANSKNYDLNLLHPLESDILVLSNAANFGYWLKRAHQPVILDLVDGYIGENPSLFRDLLRNVARSFRGNSSLRWVLYTNHLKKACALSSAVIVASPEQREFILPFNSKVFVVLDDHSELEFNHQLPSEVKDSNSSGGKFVFWEGFGYTLKHFKFMAKTLDQALYENNWGMYLLTVRTFARWGGYIGKVTTSKVIKKWFPLSKDSIHIIPWSLENLMIYARKSQFAIIPINPNDKFAMNKSENKLLSAWTLGLPTVFSNIPSYSRVSNFTQTTTMCVDSQSWKAKLEQLMHLGSNEMGLPITVKEYLERTHSRELLISKWDALFNQTIKDKDV